MDPAPDCSYSTALSLASRPIGASSDLGAGAMHGGKIFMGPDGRQTVDFSEHWWCERVREYYTAPPFADGSENSSETCCISENTFTTFPLHELPEPSDVARSAGGAREVLRQMVGEEVSVKLPRRISSFATR